VEVRSKPGETSAGGLEGNKRGSLTFAHLGRPLPPAGGNIGFGESTDKLTPRALAAMLHDIQLVLADFLPVPLIRQFNGYLFVKQWVLELAIPGFEMAPPFRA